VGSTRQLLLQPPAQMGDRRGIRTTLPAMARPARPPQMVLPAVLTAASRPRQHPPRGRRSPVAAAVSSMPLRLALPSGGNPTSGTLLAALFSFCVLSSLHLSFLACSIVGAAAHLFFCLFLSPIRLHSLRDASSTKQTHRPPFSNLVEQAQERNKTSPNQAANGPVLSS
jgi:hypothetical protein